MKLKAYSCVITPFWIFALLLTLLSGCTRTYSSLEDAVRGITAHRETVTVLNGIESCMIVYTDGHSKYTKHLQRREMAFISKYYRRIQNLSLILPLR